MVKKKAKTLTVATAGTALTASTATNAGNAGNAANLAGQPPSRYESQAYAFALTSISISPSFALAGVPAGTYTVSWNLLFNATGTDDYCYLTNSTGVQDAGFAYLTPGGGYESAVSSTVTTVGSGSVLSLVCSTTGTQYASNPNYPAYVTFTRVTHVAAGAATARTAHAVHGSEQGPAAAR